MEKTNFTPGNWEANLTQVETENMVICNAFVRTRKGFISLQEAEANAKLISAAPELLGLAEQFKVFLKGKEDSLIYKQVELTIKKATGI